MAVLHDYKCAASSCACVFEAATTPDGDAVRCPSCDSTKVKRLITFGQTSPTFTQRLYPFFHQGIGEVVQSEAQLNRRCRELDFVTSHEGAHMTAKQERRLLSKRVDNRPREVVQERVRWSGKGANLPTFETGESPD